MMISPETYFELEVRGKSAEKLKTTVKKLRAEERELEEKVKKGEWGIKPSYDTQLSMTREYLAVTRAALTLAEYGIHI